VIVTADADILNVAFVNDVGLVTVTLAQLASFTVHLTNVYQSANVPLSVTLSSNLYFHVSAGCCPVAFAVIDLASTHAGSSIVHM
jgi:hypothetical protein